jgi:hypothetical protein
MKTVPTHLKEEDMRQTTIRQLSLTGLIILSLALWGCAGTLAQSPQQTKTTEDLLSAAGFQQIFATTAKLKAHLASMPQKQIFMASRGPKLFYVYADANGCGCLYAGNQQQYQAYKNLAAQYQMAAMEYQTAQMNLDASMNWDWGEWGEAGPWF